MQAVEASQPNKRGTRNRSHRRSRWNKPRILLLTMTTALIANPAIFNQSAKAQSVMSAPGTERISFNIPGQSLNRALVAYSTATGNQMFFDASLVRGKIAPAVSGSFTRAEALDRLLAGSNLSYRFSGNTVQLLDTQSAANVSTETELKPIVLSNGSGYSPDAPYRTAGSAAYISEEQIERFRGTSVGDFLGGVPGVLNGDSRNSGAVDVNIRGMQGQGRVPVIVDGATQETTVYQGYNGSTARTYIDPDFIGDVAIEKGVSMGADATGATGGVVRMRTIEARDILLPGKDFGVRVKGSFNTNSSSIPAPATLGGMEEGSGALPPGGMDRPAFLNPTGGSGSIAAAASTEFLDIVAGYARRKNGNYYAGSHGKGAPVLKVVPDDFYGSLTKIVGISKYRQGEEILNTSLDNESWMAKGKIKFDDNHSLELGYSKYKSDYGHILGSQTFITASNYQNILSSIELDTYTARYRFKPEENDLIDLKVDTFLSEVDNRVNSSNYLSAERGLSPAYFWTGSQRWGVTASNTSRFYTDFGDLSFEYGGAFTRENIGLPDGVTYNSSMFQPPREGNRRETSAFTSLEWKPLDWLKLTGNLRYSHFDTLDESSTLAEPFERSDGGWSPIGTVTVGPFDGFEFYGKIGSALRSPSIFESLTGTSFGYPVDLNPVDPERARNIEVGMNYVGDNVFMAGDRLRFHAAYFDNKIDDYITRSNVPRDFSSIGFGTIYVLGRLNLDYARMRGIDMSAEYDTGDYFASIAWNHYTDMMFCAREGSIDPLWDRCSAGGIFNSFSAQQVPPKDTVTVNLGARFLDERLTLGSRLTYVGSRYIDGTGWGGNTVNTALGLGGIMPSKWEPYTLVDLYGSYKVNENASLDFAVDNVTDRYYVDALSTVGIPAPGRTFRASFTVKF